ncbi:SRPBCC family protein [Aquimarina macrocephali]|uniref:SRPBCC family protein n=1 Tax=Aquimarina macrocephali TaxID=666563 RepID=UPI000463F4D3|nr:SRPBCC family protein [Aquimarina macrocephali]
MILTILAIILILFFGIGLYNANKLKNIHIQTTVNINADIQTIFDNVLYLKNFPKWSPFYEVDPTQKIEVKGNDGEVGAQFHWNGNNGKDLGYQEIKEIKPLEYIKMECDIQKPFKANPTFEYSFSNLGNMVKVTQDFDLKSGLVDSFFMWLFGAKKNMEKMNERGMELLKANSEK